MNSIWVNSYFSGAGLMDLGLKKSDLKIQQSFEIDERCCETLRNNFDHEIVQGDIKSKLVADEKECDVMVATYPCTRYSKIADIKGTRTGDELFLHFFRHIAIKKPELYVVENVPGMVKFPVVMEAMTKLPDYYVSVVCPVKTETWLPQRRNRLMIFGSKKRFDWRLPENIKRKKLSGIIEEDAVVKIPDYVYNRLNGRYRDMPIITDPEVDEIAPTCLAHYGKDKGTRLVRDKRFKYGVRPYTTREYARLQGVPDPFTFSGPEGEIYKQIGNGVPVDMAYWVGAEIKRYFLR